jgi:hypothetical protein
VRSVLRGFQEATTWAAAQVLSTLQKADQSRAEPGQSSKEFSGQTVGEEEACPG